VKSRHHRNHKARHYVTAGFATIVAATLLAACGSDGKPKTPSPSATSSAAPSSAAASPTASPTPAGAPVHVSLLFGDGAVVGVGMPIIAYFSQKITDPTDFLKATKVSINGQPNKGHWYFEKSARPGSPIEAHYRAAQDPTSQDPYLPAHATINMDMKTQGLSGGKADDGTQFVFDNSLTLEFSTGAKTISTVDCAKLRMSTVSDGKDVFDAPISCGKAKTATYNGTKVVMQKGESLPGSSALRPNGAVRMKDTQGTYDEVVSWSVRVTNSGEYVHAAPWNSRIGAVSTSNGCTNLDTGDAKKFYALANVGDVLVYSGSPGGSMPEWDGYGDWNVSSAAWNGGGLLDTTG
jgi:lipoprotein-anchoring transpeptidase ErfK/SrfK